jgi:hypothetical protein
MFTKKILLTTDQKCKKSAGPKILLIPLYNKGRQTPMNVNVIFKNRIPQNSIEKIERGTLGYRI